MSIEKNEFLVFISGILKAKDLKHEISSFDSGYMMIDIWYRENLYVVQYEKDKIGLSEITKESVVPFDPRADEYYFTLEEFKEVFTGIFI